MGKVNNNIEEYEGALWLGINGKTIYIGVNEWFVEENCLFIVRNTGGKVQLEYEDNEIWVEYGTSKIVTVQNVAGVDLVLE